MGYWPMTFDTWYHDPEKEEWWNNNYEDLKKEWETLEKLGVHREVIAKVFDNVIDVIRKEYGE